MVDLPSLVNAECVVPTSVWTSIDPSSPSSGRSLLQIPYRQIPLSQVIVPDEVFGTHYFDFYILYVHVPIACGPQASKPVPVSLLYSAQLLPDLT